ncbi:SDR family NAD(P)-dependent oxidoreductase [Croceicoccus mobilis]|uniref:Short-chain dehydrogenase n=1 Tax=Croceicoccus mobilis TaxID=1703339 RepID=A0A916Z540_9SPHN|nr:SDR family NAD(P)-dependent oxidoreductase [Croceicoccus mobilis]GGD77215.1 short-chain dehydrogenase [Croceicoccus mobilis]
MSNGMKRIALVTGANKGIGLEIARQLAQAGVFVLMGARDAARGKAAADELLYSGLNVASIQIAVDERESVASAISEIKADHGRLDILVNNAGIAPKGDGPPSVTSLEIGRQIFDTNFFGALAVTQAALPMLRKSAAGRIVNLSSSLGSLALNGDPTNPFYDVRLLAYNASKTALNMLTVQLNAELSGSKITAVSVCPGLTNTDLSGNLGWSTAEGAAAPAKFALMTDGSHAGAFVNMDGALPW